MRNSLHIWLLGQQRKSHHQGETPAVKWPHRHTQHLRQNGLSTSWMKIKTHKRLETNIIFFFNQTRRSAAHRLFRLKHAHTYTHKTFLTLCFHCQITSSLLVSHIISCFKRMRGCFFVLVVFCKGNISLSNSGRQIGPWWPIFNAQSTGMGHESEIQTPNRN